MSNSENKGVVCDHCHGEGHTDCPTCHGKGKNECSKCHGDGEVTCSKCEGQGKFSNCSKCNSSGKMTCSKCGGSGKMREKCANCSGSGRVTRTRLVYCSKCHGTGISGYRSSGKPYSCSYCHGSRQVKEEYTITCPTCGGRGRSQYEVTCSRCKGSKQETCSRCKGTGHAVCSVCDGSGKVECDNCKGEGGFKCNDCSGAGNHICVECYGTGVATESGVPKIAVGSICETANALEKKKDYVHAFLKYREAAEKDHSTGSLWRLGKMYAKGQAVPKSIKKANILYRASANAGNRVALCLLGRNYLNGEGVDQNKSEARRLLELSVAKGYEDAKESFQKVATEKLVRETPSGVVGWHGKFEVPKFVLDADPVADQEAKIAKEKQEKRAAFMVRLRRSLWWWLFRGAAAAVFAFGWTKYSEAWSNGEYAAILAGGFVLTSFCIRPKFAETGYMLLTIGAVAATYCVADGSIVPWSLALLISLTTLFMRNLGEKMSFPILTYPLMGAAVGFLASPLCCYDTLAKGKAEASIIFEIIAVVVYLYNIGDIHGKGGCVAKGKRTPQIATTLLVLAVLAGAVGFFVYDTRHIQRVIGSDTEKIESRQVVETVKEEQKHQQQLDNLTDFEIGMRYKKGDGVEQNVSKARKYLERAVKKKDRDAEFELGRILIDEGRASEGWQLIKQAADFGHQEANYMLGEKAQNDGKSNEAFHAFFEAARNGHVKSMVKVADYYAEKTGVFGARRDKAKAIEWYKKAAVKGSEDAKKALSEL